MASYSRRIPPGGEGKITVQVMTTGYGDRPISKSVQVFTSDPQRPKFELTVSGKVESFANIDNRSVNFHGKVGEALRQTVRIAPSERHPFIIREAKPWKGEFIHVALEKDPTDKSYRLIVENRKQERGPYFDRIDLTTDNPMHPIITIVVTGVIY